MEYLGKNVTQSKIKMAGIKIINCLKKGVYTKPFG